MGGSTSPRMMTTSEPRCPNSNCVQGSMLNNTVGLNDRRTPLIGDKIHWNIEGPVAHCQCPRLPPRVKFGGGLRIGR